ncbi:hypothetical protein [Dietzia cinnamea]|uniref:hypothetical protein n=1 Tax=Dietzia cinnamea TaxID=321318 RepID=UPI0021A57ECF|nr:hypothetical protein [Dietzia cinnamea]MCT2121573.1 hypothetical protein [Dietzia cinnamea]
MSIPKISGREARELLDGTIDGPWSVEVHKRYDIIVSPVGYAVAYNEDNPEDGRANSELLAAAPALAETVAWLYGRKSDDEAVWDDKYEVSVMVDGTVAVFDHEATTTFFTRDEAVEFARALLAAAEEARP